MVGGRWWGIAALVVVAIPSSGCFVISVERLPPAVDPADLASLQDRVAPGTGGVLLWDNRERSGLYDDLKTALRRSGLFREIRTESGTEVRHPPESTSDSEESREAPGPTAADWILSHECRYHTGGLGGDPTAFILTLGLFPLISTSEFVDIFRFSKANGDPAEAVWIGVPGTRGRVDGLAGLFLALLPSWEFSPVDETAHGRMGEHLILQLSKSVFAFQAGRTGETDPEVLRMRAEVKRNSERWSFPPEEVLREQRALEQRLREGQEE